MAASYALGTQQQVNAFSDALVTEYCIICVRLLHKRPRRVLCSLVKHFNVTISIYASMSLYFLHAPFGRDQCEYRTALSQNSDSGHDCNKMIDRATLPRPEHSPAFSSTSSGTTCPSPAVQPAFRASVNDPDHRPSSVRVPSRHIFSECAIEAVPADLHRSSGLL